MEITQIRSLRHLASGVSTGYRHVGSLHAGPISWAKWCGTSHTLTVDSASSRLVSTARTTNESRESLQPPSNYMIIRCAAVGFNAEALCRGYIWVGSPPL